MSLSPLGKGTFPPNGSLFVYSALFKIETVLRELIIETLENIDGPLWYKSRLPEDILQKYRDGLSRERTRWTHLIPHHPIYYTDFSHLRIIIERNDNWNDAFNQIFGRRDLLGAMLGELELIRNRVAHNRKLHERDIEFARQALTQLSDITGERRIEVLLGRIEESNDIGQELLDLKKAALETYSALVEFRPIDISPDWKRASNAWWFDDSYLGSEIDGIQHFFGLVREYSELPRIRGQGHLIEKWTKEHDVRSTFELAIHQFDALLDELGS